MGVSKGAPSPGWIRACMWPGGAFGPHDLWLRSARHLARPEQTAVNGGAGGDALRGPCWELRVCGCGTQPPSWAWQGSMVRP